MDINIDFEIDTLTESVEEAVRLLPGLVENHIANSPNTQYIVDEDIIESVLVIARDANNEVRIKVLDALRELVDDPTDIDAQELIQRYDDVIEFYIRKSLQESANRIQSASTARQIMDADRPNAVTDSLDRSVSTAKNVATAEILASAALFSTATSLENGYSYYSYETSDDEVVREEHRRRDGKIFAYGRQRVADDVPKLAFQCRCFDFPLTDEEVLDRLDDFFYPEDAPSGVGARKTDMEQVRMSLGFKGAQNNVEVTGTVGDYFEYNDFASFKAKVEQDLGGDEEKELVLDITSHGGFAYDGLAAYSYLSSLPNKVTANIYGFAGSAATAFIAAADTVTADAVDQVLIHKAWTIGLGDAEDLRKTADELDIIDGSLITAYQRKTGRSEQEIRDLMAEDAYISAERAMEFGLVDIIRQPKEMAKAETKPLAQADQQTEDVMSDKERAQLEQQIADVKAENEALKTNLATKEAEALALAEKLEKAESIDVDELVEKRIAAKAELEDAVKGAKERVTALGVEPEGDSVESVFENAAKSLNLHKEGYEEAQIMAAINTYEQFYSESEDDELGAKFLGKASVEDKPETKAEKFKRLQNKEG